LIVTNPFGELVGTDDCFVGISAHIRFSFLCVGGTVLSAESAAGVQHWAAFGVGFRRLRRPAAGYAAFASRLKRSMPTALTSDAANASLISGSVEFGIGCNHE
jgi:hypothetical protein